MFNLGPHQQFCLYACPTDMRKSFDALSGVVRDHLDRDPHSGEVFMFINKRRDKLKLLHWVGSGFVLYYKRLEEGVFDLPEYDQNARAMRLSYAQLVMLVDGISLLNIQRKKRFNSATLSG